MAPTGIAATNPTINGRFVFTAFISLLLLLSLPKTTLTHVATAATVAAGDPIDFATVGDFSDSPNGQLYNALNMGINLSFSINNNLRNGVWGRPLRLIASSSNNESLTYGLLNQVYTAHPNLTGVVAINGEESVNAAVRFVKDNNMTLMQPTVGIRRLFQFSKDWINFIPSPDADIYNMVRHAIYTHQATRIAVVTETFDEYGSEMVPDITALIESVGAKMTYHMKLDRFTNPDTYDIPKLQQLIATKPHVVINMGGIYANTAATYIALLVSLPNVYAYSPAGLLPLVDFAIRQLPSASMIQDRVLITSYGPLYTDTTYDLTKRFRAEIAAYPNEAQINLAILDSTPPLGVYVFFGWVMGELIQRMTYDLRTMVDPLSLKKNIYTDKFYSVEDYILGPYSGPCTGTRTQFCSCNNGARINSLIRYTEQLSLVAVERSNFTLPYTVCDAEKLPLASLLIAATLTPTSSPESARVTSDYLIGRSAAATTGDILVDGVLVAETYSGNSTAALQSVNTEKLMTASAGTVLNSPIGDSTAITGLGAVIDPIELRPRLYGTFRRDVVYVSPTYDQELHALAHLAVSQKVSISVLSALEDGDDVGAMLTRSLNTFGQEGGGHRTASNIASGLASQGDGSGITILHGIATSADITAIAAYLARSSSGMIAIPMAHLDAWYREIVAAVTDPNHQSRIVFATSLPNWGGPSTAGTNGAVMQTYFDRVPATNRTPASLRGFMTHQLLTYIIGRIPTQKTPAEFLRMLYGASVIVMDTGLVVGPYFDTVCTTTSTADESCDMNIGARWIRVRSIAASVTDPLTGNASGLDASSITLDSGRIKYQRLPTSDKTVSTIVIIVAVVGSVSLIAGILAVFVVCCCTGRSNRTAPKDESEAFTIAFTDIQSSTALWAEAPEAMAPALDHHHALIRKLCSKHNGYEVKTIGDAFMIAFRDARDAVELASALQLTFLNDKRWSQQIDHAYLEMDHRNTQTLNLEERAMYSIALGQEDYARVWNGLRVRIGIHTGFGEIKKDPVSQGYDYYGTVVNTAARTEAIAHGGQVTLTDACVSAAQVNPSRLTSLGHVVLRGVSEPVAMYQLATVPNRVFPPLRVEMAQKEEAELDVTMNNSTRSHQSTHSTSTKKNPVLLHQRRMARNLLDALCAVMVESKKAEWVKEMCREWRVQTAAPPLDDNKEIMLDHLAVKLAPILAKKLSLPSQSNNNGGGGADVGDRSTVEVTAPFAYEASSLILASSQPSATNSHSSIWAPGMNVTPEGTHLLRRSSEIDQNIHGVPFSTSLISRGSVVRNSVLGISAMGNASIANETSATTMLQQHQQYHQPASSNVQQPNSPEFSRWAPLI